MNSVSKSRETTETPKSAKQAPKVPKLAMGLGAGLLLMVSGGMGNMLLSARYLSATQGEVQAKVKRLTEQGLGDQATSCLRAEEMCMGNVERDRPGFPDSGVLERAAATLNSMAFPLGEEANGRRDCRRAVLACLAAPDYQ